MQNNQILNDALEALGFPKKEREVLIFLLSIPYASASTIGLRVGVKRSTCYLVLDSLAQKGLVLKDVEDSVLRYRINQKYPFKLERDMHVAASKQIEKAFVSKKNSLNPIDFDEILDVTVQVAGDRLNELIGIFIIEEDDLVFRQAHLMEYGSSIFKFVGIRLFGLRTSVNAAKNYVAKTAKTGRSFFDTRLSKFVSPMVSEKVADGIQAIPGFKFVYCYPIKTRKKIYGTGMISFRTREDFSKKKRIFEQIMDKAAECVELKVTIRSFEQKNFDIEDIKSLQNSVKALPSEIFGVDAVSDFSDVKMFELKKLRILK